MLCKDAALCFVYSHFTHQSYTKHEGLNRYFNGCHVQREQICHVTNGITYYTVCQAQYAPFLQWYILCKEPAVHRLRQRAILLYSELQDPSGCRKKQSTQLHQLNLYQMYIMSEYTFSSAVGDRFYLWDKLTALPWLTPISATGKYSVFSISFSLWQVGSCMNIKFSVKSKKVSRILQISVFLRALLNGLRWVGLLLIQSWICVFPAESSTVQNDVCEESETLSLSYINLRRMESVSVLIDNPILLSRFVTLQIV